MEGTFNLHISPPRIAGQGARWARGRLRRGNQTRIVTPHHRLSMRQNQDGRRSPRLPELKESDRLIDAKSGGKLQDTSRAGRIITRNHREILEQQFGAAVNICFDQ